MRLILARHGNTFNLDDPVVWTGSSNDLALVEKGKEQARTMGRWLAKNNIQPSFVFSGSLKRVHDFATISLQEAGLEIEPLIDSRLNEIDYGGWTGLTDKEVIERYSEEDLNKWRNYSIFPKSGWGDTEESVMKRVGSFVQDLCLKTGNQTAYVISSNGILRYFLKALDPRVFEHHIKEKNFAVKTGHYCILDIQDYTKKAKLDVVCWNEKPQ